MTPKHRDKEAKTAPPAESACKRQADALPITVCISTSHSTTDQSTPDAESNNSNTPSLRRYVGKFKLFVDIFRNNIKCILLSLRYKTQYFPPATPRKRVPSAL